MPNEIELKTREIDEIFGKTPSWLTQWGISIIFVAFLFILIGSFFFKYPDVIKASVIIISENPPASIVAHANGKIDYLFVQNEKQVQPGEILAILENTANQLHITALKDQLHHLSSLFTSETTSYLIDLPNQYVLGPVQTSYSNFQRQYQEYRNYLAINLIEKKIGSIQQQLMDYSTYSERLQAQAYNQEKTVQLNHQQFKRDSSLYAREVIPAADFEKSEQNYLQVKNNYQSLLASLASTQMQVNQLKYQIIDLQSQKIDQSGRFLNLLKEAYDNLKAAIAEWEKAYTLSSPIDGKVTFTKFWSKNQYVMAGDIVFTVVPSKPQRIIGRMKLPSNGSGKVKVGQKVHIRLGNFPYMEFGMVEGKIESISMIPESDEKEVFYTAEVSLPKGLTTNYKKILPLSQEMQGAAEIITKNLTLFERFIDPIKSALKKSL